MPWIEPDDSPDYHFLTTGELQYRDRCGQFRIAGGCTGDTWFTFLALRDQALDILGQSEAVSPEEVYISAPPFRQLCDTCLTYSGIDPAVITPRQVIRLLFARQEGETVIPAPLISLSEPPPRRHPPIPGSDGQPISDKAALIAALIGQTDNPAQVDELLRRPMREALAVADDLAWQATPKEHRQKAQMLQDSKNSARRIDSFLEQIPAAPPAPREEVASGK